MSRGKGGFLKRIADGEADMWTEKWISRWKSRYVDREMYL
jgi:hypothetical protein